MTGARAIVLIAALLATSAALVAADEPPEKEWGSYYDPQNIFCGKYDCYRILGFDYESFGRDPPDKKDITKSYRSLSRKWHPDKNRGRGAKDRFVKINKAYEVLTNEETRTEYDFFRYRPDEYFIKYGSSVLWSYAPKSDVRVIALLLLLVATTFSWWSQKRRWQQVADHLVRAAVEDWGPRDGGSTESMELRQKALQILAEREAAAEQQNGKNGTTSPAAATPSPKKKKLTGQEKKKQVQEELRVIVLELVHDMHDFGGGFHKPTWRDLLVVRLVQLPVTVGKGLVWNAKYFVRRMQKLELTEEEREVLTRRAVGEIAWAAVADEEKKEMTTLDLWETENLEEWREDQELKRLSGGNTKKYAKMKKKGGKAL